MGNVVQKKELLAILQMSTATESIARKILAGSYPFRLKYKLPRGSCDGIACRNQDGLKATTQFLCFYALENQLVHSKLVRMGII